MSAVMETFKNEGSLAPVIPYESHLTDSVVLLDNGSIMTVFRLDGAAHETEDDKKLLEWHESLCNALMSVSSPELALWRTTYRYEAKEFAAGLFEPGFAHDLNEAYRKRCERELLFVNELYLAVLLRDPGSLARFGRGKKGMELVREDQLAKLEQTANKLAQSLEKFKPVRLGVRQELNVHFSEVYEYLALLVNGRKYKVPLTPHRAGDILSRCRMTWGSDTFCRDFSDRREYGAILAANAYPAQGLMTGHLNKTLNLPFPYVMTHSFTYMGGNAAKEAVSLQGSRMKASGDDAAHEIQAFAALKADIQSRVLTLGQHDMTMCVSAPDAKTLAQRLALAEENCTDAGFIMNREDLALQAAYVAQLPGNYKFRPRRSPITTRNYAALMAFHNYPTGRRDDNQWGPATTMFLTEGGSPFFASLHDMRKTRSRGGAESTDDKVAGNTLVLGPTGGGKTTLQTFMVAQQDKAKPTVFTFDRSRGQEIFVRAMGGIYTELKRGKDTGFNFLRLEPTGENIAFAIDTVRHLASGGDQLPADYEEALTQRTRFVMEHEPWEARNLTYLSHALDQTSEWTTRLNQWCDGGPNAWAFCSGEDRLDFSGNRHFGFDATDFLNDDGVRAPIMGYLFHRVNSFLGTRPAVINIDEMRAFLKDLFFRHFIEDTLLLIRKKDAIAILGTQQANHVLDSPIADTLVEQTQTKIVLPNTSAQAKHYIDGLGFSPGEYDLIQRILPATNPRSFLFKQPSVSAVCNLNLAGMNKELAVLSGTDKLIVKMQAAIKAAGSENPDVWLPYYYDIIRSN